MEPSALNPYAAPLHGADTPAIGDGPVVYVGFWRRVLASIVDNILTTVVVLPLFWLLYGTWTAQGMFESRALLQNLLVAVVIITLWHRYGATPGKMMWNARILDERTLRPPPWAS